jgi:hypothetical protein
MALIGGQMTFAFGALTNQVGDGQAGWIPTGGRRR